MKKQTMTNRHIRAIKYFIVLMCLNIYTIPTSQAQESFKGRWDYYDYSSDGGIRFSFTVDLNQIGNKIEGYHFISADYGSYIDDYIDMSIHGKVTDNVATITIKSGRGYGKPGVATVKHVGKDSVLFELTKAPLDGADNVMPDSIILTKNPIDNFEDLF